MGRLVKRRWRGYKLKQIKSCKERLDRRKEKRTRRRDKLDEEDKLKREKEKYEDMKIEEEEKRIREKEKREQEEYEKLKAVFSVEDEGCDAGSSTISKRLRLVITSPYLP